MTIATTTSTRTVRTSKPVCVCCGARAYIAPVEFLRGTGTVQWITGRVVAPGTPICEECLPHLTPVE